LPGLEPFTAAAKRQRALLAGAERLGRRVLRNDPRARAGYFGGGCRRLGRRWAFRRVRRRGEAWQKSEPGGCRGAADKGDAAAQR
jgi:hypothetical protein